MSRLLIDIGNTRLKWAWCDDAPVAAEHVVEGGAVLPSPWRHGGAAAHAVPA